MSNLAFTIEKPISATQPAASVANVVPFRRPGHQFPKRNLVAGAYMVDALKGVRTSLPATAVNRGTSRRSGWKVENNFARTASENDVRLTPMELLLTALLFMSVATVPTLVWLLLRTPS
jgi:hypothetical protein